MPVVVTRLVFRAKARVEGVWHHSSFPVSLDSTSHGHCQSWRGLELDETVGLRGRGQFYHWY